MINVKLEPIRNEEMYVLVAPDGTWQALTLSPGFPTCVAQIQLMHSKKLAKSYHELSIKGFQILPVRITIIQDGTEEEGFQRAKSKLG